MKKNMLLTIALVVLVIVSAVQALQLAKIKSDLENNALAIKSKSVKPVVKSSSGSDVSVPKSLENLPQMVGGC